MIKKINMKKSFSLTITLVIVGLMITSVAGLPLIKISTEHSLKVDKNERKIVELDISTEHLSLQYEEVEKKFINQLSSIGSWSVFESVGDQLHPGFGRTEDGIQVASFYDSDYDQIMYTFSVDEGQTFNSELLYWEIGGDYPSIKLWDGQQFHGTFVTDSQDHNGGSCYLLTCTDPTDYETYSMLRADTDELGFYDMIDADIACNSEQQPWEWGASSFVISKSLIHGYTNCPTVTFADPYDEYKLYISYYDINGCKHCDVDIDRNKQYMYAVYDWENTSSGMWEILVWKKNMSDPLNSNWLYRIQGAGNLSHPAVAANDNNIVILAVTDENGNKDIICYYTNDGNIENLQTSIVVDTSDDEEYPDVRSFDDDNFISTYLKNNNLYGPLTEDGGVNWVEVNWQINENSGCVLEEYKTSDLCEGGLLAMWEDSCGEDIDIYMGNTLNDNPPSTPSQPSGPIFGYMCLSYDYFTSSTDPDGDNIKYGWDWDGDLVVDEWTDWYGSGDNCSISHSWKKPGTYNVSVKVKDIYAYESSWSDSLIVTIEYLYGKTVYVGGTGEDNYTKIQDAVNNVIDGFTVFVFDDSSPYYETIDIIRKSINLIGENRDTTIIDGHESGNVIHAISCSYLNISGFTIRNAGYLFEEKYLIYMVSCEYCNISHNICNDNTIILKDSHDNQIFKNIAKRNSESIILFDSKRNTISYNYLSNSYGGIELYRSPDNIIHHNNIYNNYFDALYFEDSPNCNIYMNNIEKNKITAIVFDRSPNCNIYMNNIENNKNTAIRVEKSDSSFYCNNFINNIRNIVIYGPGDYDFDSNYWDRPRSSPKLILGWRWVMIFPPEDPWYPGYWILVPKFIYDYNPAQKPYDIPVISIKQDCGIE